MDLLGGIQGLPLHSDIQRSVIGSLLCLLLFCKVLSSCLWRATAWNDRKVRMNQHASVLFWLQHNSVDRMYIQHTQSLFAEIIKFSKDAKRCNT